MRCTEERHRRPHFSQVYDTLLGELNDVAGMESKNLPPRFQTTLSRDKLPLSVILHNR